MQISNNKNLPKAGYVIQYNSSLAFLEMGMLTGISETRHAKMWQKMSAGKMECVKVNFC